jgi:large subunit ribosomal protein L3
MGKRAHHPRRGSLAYSPRKRAASPIPRVRSWREEEKPRLMGFAGYKAGMTHVGVVDDYPNSPTHGEEIARPVTVLEVPPVRVFGYRVYGRDASGLKVLSEVWSQELSEDLRRVFPLPKSPSQSQPPESPPIQEGEIAEVRAILHTQPTLTPSSRKTPEIMEVPLGGPREGVLERARELLGKEIRITDVFEEGEFVDAIAVTKGKGFQGVVKRWGVKHLPRKTRKGHRTAGNLGPWHPAAMMWTVPTSGQMGYHQRTERNLRILKIGSGEEINPKGGFLGHGPIRGDYLLLGGSIPGPRKRTIRLRAAIRPSRRIPEGIPTLTYVSRESKQGV